MHLNLEKLPVGSGLVSLSGAFLWGSDSLKEEINVAADDPLDFTFQDITHPDDLGPDLENVDRLLSGEVSRYAMDKRYVYENGDPFWVDLNVALHRDEDGAPEHFVVCIKNIQERKEMEEEIRRMAYVDPLTGLANRAAFLEYAERMISAPRGRFACVGIVDLNDLKGINDRLGHRAGDRAICAAGRALEQIVGDDGIVARLGGDEFGIVLTHASRRLIQLSQNGEMRDSIEVQGRTIGISAAVGFSGCMHDVKNVLQLMAQADERMYACKRLSKAGPFVVDEIKQA